MTPLLLGVLVITTRLCCSASAAYPPLQIPSFKLSDLQAPSDATLQSVADAISNLGMFAVNDFQADCVAHNALSQFASCALMGDLDLRQVELEDGALRRTLATATTANGPQSLPASALDHCPDLAPPAHQLRTAVAAAGTAYAGILDKLLYGSAACTTPDRCFKDAVRTGEGLEHFHLFESAASPKAEQMLSMHSDIGLFLVMSPAELFERTTGASDAFSDCGDAAGSDGGKEKPQQSRDLVVQLADSRIVRPVLADGSLLVMNGEGLLRWMHKPAPGGVRPYSPMHAVLSSKRDATVRAWFGRMFMPPEDSRLHATDGRDSDTGNQQDFAAARRLLTFAEYRQNTYELFNAGKGREASTVGCSPSRRLLVDESSCGAQEVYCWMSCMPITPSLTCGKSEILCANINNPSLLWPRNYINPETGQPTHCKDCALMCPLSPPPDSDGGAPVPLPPSSSSFCNTNLGSTTMWMTGFQFAQGNERGPCVVYLFPEWVLDSAGKFAGACIGTFFMGIAVGLLGWVRTWLRNRWIGEGLWQPDYSPRWHTWSADAALIMIIAVQVCLGYWLMLIAMTYQAELFIMVVLGLAFGHYANRPPMNRRSSAVSGSDDDTPRDPCCSA